MSVLYTIMGLGFAGVVALGWLVLLVTGVVNLRRGQRNVGLVLTIVGGLWGLAVLIGAGFTYYTLSSYSNRSRESTVTFDASNYKGPMATLTVDWAEGPSTLNLRYPQEKKQYRCSATNGVFQVPAGTGSVQSWQANVTDKAQRSWSLECSYPRTYSSLTLAANQKQALALGPPLVASVSATQAGKGMASLNFVLKDQAGHDYKLMSYGKGATPPKFEALDSANQVLWSGKFEYG